MVQRFCYQGIYGVEVGPNWVFNIGCAISINSHNMGLVSRAVNMESAAAGAVVKILEAGSLFADTIRASAAGLHPRGVATVAVGAVMMADVTTTGAARSGAPVHHRLDHRRRHGVAVALTRRRTIATHRGITGTECQGL